MAGEETNEESGRGAFFLYRMWKRSRNDRRVETTMLRRRTASIVVNHGRTACPESRRSALAGAEPLVEIVARLHLPDLRAGQLELLLHERDALLDDFRSLAPLTDLHESRN